MAGRWRWEIRPDAVPSTRQSVCRSGVRACAGQTVMFVAVDGHVAGLIGVGRLIKASSADAIAALHREGLQVVMLTGDNRTTAKAVAERLRIDRVEAEILPDQKAEIVRRLQAEGIRLRWRVTASMTHRLWPRRMSVSPWGQVRDVAMESAGMTLVKGDLRGIVRPAPEQGDHAQHPAEPVLRIRLQHPLACRWRLGSVSCIRPVARR